MPDICAEYYFMGAAAMLQLRCGLAWAAPPAVRCAIPGLLGRRHASSVRPFDHDRLRQALGAIALPAAPATSLRYLLRLPGVYASLCKARLSGLVVTTTFAGYALAATPASPLLMLQQGSLWTTLVGTALCAGAANAWNQWAESPHDARMARTRLRPLPTGQISPAHAFGCASVCAGAGLSALYLGSGAAACGLAAATIGLYTLVYTPMKRFTVLNTWVGAVVGGIPPLIGYAGALGDVALGSLVPEAALLGAVLYCWQFPHFNALSHNLRHDYGRAGYCMASIERPALNRSSALVHAALLLPLTVACTPAGAGMASWWFLLDGGLAAGWLTVLAARFSRRPSRATARGLFLGSLVYLPVFLALLLLHKT